VATSVAARLTQLAARLGEIDQVIVRVAGDIVVEQLTRQLAADTGGDQALSGFRGGRYRLTLQIDPLRNPAGVRIRPAAKQSGMWTILDSGHRGGYQVAARPRRRHKRGVKKGSSRAAAMNIGGWHAGPFTVKRPSRGHRTWSKGRDAGISRAVEAVRLELSKVVNGG
jgi:hypothetical protein